MALGQCLGRSSQTAGLRLNTLERREGVRLKLTLASRSVTQKTFYELAGIDPKTLARFFDGKRVTYQTSISISNAYFKLMAREASEPHRGVSG